jgi:hypothetical protein
LILIDWVFVVHVTAFNPFTLANEYVGNPDELRADVTTPALSSHENPDVPDPLTVVLSDASNHPINPEFIKGVNGVTFGVGNR